MSKSNERTDQLLDALKTIKPEYVSAAQLEQKTGISHTTVTTLLNKHPKVKTKPDVNSGARTIPTRLFAYREDAQELSDRIAKSRVMR
jgi:transcriptional antiterminator